ncbi:MAG: hypothetical protein NZ531_05615, partial [Aquificaceae bacterium]|nr:hypothetical protein [Aquificaceae bacterium]
GIYFIPMGIFIEDLLNFGNLIDAELEFKLRPSDIKRAYNSLDFEIKDSLLIIIVRKKVLFLNKSTEVRLSEGDATTKKERESQRQWVFFKILSRNGLQEVLKTPGFKLEGEKLGMDVMPIVILTETYEKIPKQFKDKLLINRYRIGKDSLSVFFKFEK